MAVLQASIFVRIYKHGASFVSLDEIESAINLADLEKVAQFHYGNSPYRSTLLQFLNLDLSNFDSEFEPSEKFFKRISIAQQNLVNWLNNQSLESIAKLKTNNGIDVFIELWINQDQMEWKLPSSLLLACGRLNLDIESINND